MYEWVDLRPADVGLDPAQVGAVVAAIHRVPFTDAGQEPLDPWYLEPVGAQRWDQLVAQLTQAGAPFAGRCPICATSWSRWRPGSSRRRRFPTCHRDLWADNLLGTAQGGVCVIDWENSGPADPSQELGCVLFEFARSDPGRAHDLVAAYRRAGGPGRVSRRGHFSMLIAQLGHITEVAAADWLQPNVRSPNRADSAAWISEVLDEPHTRALLDSLRQAAL